MVWGILSPQKSMKIMNPITSSTEKFGVPWLAAWLTKLHAPWFDQTEIFRMLSLQSQHDWR